MPLALPLPPSFPRSRTSTASSRLSALSSFPARRSGSPGPLSPSLKSLASSDAAKSEVEHTISTGGTGRLSKLKKQISRVILRTSPSLTSPDIANPTSPTTSPSEPLPSDPRGRALPGRTNASASAAGGGLSRRVSKLLHPHPFAHTSDEQDLSIVEEACVPFLDYANPIENGFHHEGSDRAISPFSDPPRMDEGSFVNFNEPVEQKTIGLDPSFGPLNPAPSPPPSLPLPPLPMPTLLPFPSVLASPTPIHASSPPHFIHPFAAEHTILLPSAAITRRYPDVMRGDDVASRKGSWLSRSPSSTSLSLANRSASARALFPRRPSLARSGRSGGSGPGGSGIWYSSSSIASSEATWDFRCKGLEESDEIVEKEEEDAAVGSAGEDGVSRSEACGAGSAERSGPSLSASPSSVRIGASSSQASFSGLALEPYYIHPRLDECFRPPSDPTSFSSPSPPSSPPRSRRFGQFLDDHRFARPGSSVTFASSASSSWVEEAQISASVAIPVCDPSTNITEEPRKRASSLRWEIDGVQRSPSMSSPRRRFSQGVAGSKAMARSRSSPVSSSSTTLLSSISSSPGSLGNSLLASSVARTLSSSPAAEDNRCYAQSRQRAMTASSTDSAVSDVSIAESRAESFSTATTSLPPSSTNTSPAKRSRTWVGSDAGEGQGFGSDSLRTMTEGDRGAALLAKLETALELDEDLEGTAL